MREFLSVKNIKLTYQSQQSETAAIQDISFSIAKGLFVSIVGPSGCGKSTLLSCIAGLTKPTSGKIILDGNEINGVSTQIGYMLQTDNLFPWRSIYKNVLLGLEIQKKLTEENIAYVNQLLKKYGLWDFKDSYPSALSGGMRQRAALIRTLAVRPRLLLLDEAFSALDYQTRVTVSRDVYNILRSESQTMIMVTHDIPEAISMSDKIIVLSRRPATVSLIINTPFPKQRDTMAVRTSVEYSRCYETVWKEMNQ